MRTLAGVFAAACPEPTRPARGPLADGGEERFEAERGALGDLDALDEPATLAHVPAARRGSGADVAKILDAVRRDQPGEPLLEGRPLDRGGHLSGCGCVP